MVSSAAPPVSSCASTSAARGTAAISTIKLSQRYLHPGLGDMRARRMKEYRGDVKMP
jgi:hypothetical protein